jgi:hypothetical protein
MDDAALVQITRLLGLPRGSLGPEDAMSAASARCHDLATALVEEMAASDDVTGPDSATAYLEDRLAVLARYLPSDCIDEVRRTGYQAAERWAT